MLIPAGSAKATLPVITNEDNIVEEDEYFNATLSLPGAPVGAVVGTPDTAYVTITDTTGMLRLECVHLLEFMLLNCSAFSTGLCILLLCTVMIPVWFNSANYSVKEGVDSNAVIFLEALADHPDFDFTVTVRTQDGTAIRESCHHLYTLLLYGRACWLIVRHSTECWPPKQQPSTSTTF